jgi:dTDP-4-amino-4,6-dideoxygalactose transaminase
MSLGIGPGDAVFTTPYTFFATAEAISLVGARPIFVDVDSRTFNLDADKLALAIKQTKAGTNYEPKAVIAVDLFGLPADYETLEPLCVNNGLKLIEDSAQGLGGETNGRMAGAFGDIATTSFFPAKPLGCYGDGGAVFTNNPELATKIRSLRMHGKGDDKYDNVRIGMNSRLDTLQAAVLLAKLEIFSDEIMKRQQVADLYTAALSDFAEPPFVPDGYKSAWAQYTIKTDMQADLIRKLAEAGVSCGVYYRKPLHLMAAYGNLGYRVGDFPVSERICHEVISLPMHPYLHEMDIEKIVRAMF